MTTDRSPARRPRRPSARVLLTVGVLAAVTGLVVAGCSAGNGGSGAGGAEPAGMATSAGRADRDGAGSAGGAGDTGRAGGTATSGSSTSGTDVEASKQQLVYTATLDLDVRDVGGRLAQAETVVTKAGGYVADQSQYGGARGSATTTFQVPAAKYRSVLGALQKLGTRTSLRQTTQNVTETVADVDARAAAAQASLTRLRGLLKKAGDLRDVIALESAIETREADLEALQARQRALAKQVAYATVTVNLSGPEAPAPAPKGGFLVGLAAGWHGFGVFVTGVLTVVGAALPFLVLGAVLAALALVGVRTARRLRRHRGDGSEPAETSADPTES